MAWAYSLLLGIVVVALAIRWFVNASPASLARGLRIGAVVLAMAVILLLTATGRLPWLIGLIGALMPLILALVRQWGRRQAARDWEGPSGQRSAVTTRFLDMTLDHDSGELDGRVREGAFRDRQLSSMSLDELRALLGEISGDADSVNVLSTFLDRTHGDAWREAGAWTGEAGAGPAPDSGPMTRDEACRVLGVPPDAPESEIRAAHRRLMKLAHPDHGGSDYLAAKINEAKEVLLG